MYARMDRHHLNAAWRLIVEFWLRRQGRISVRESNQAKVTTDSKDIFYHDRFCTTSGART